MASGSPTTIFFSSARRQNPRISLLMYYAYQIFQRTNEFHNILRGGRLFQQFVLDQFCKIESERLQYLQQS